MPSQPASSASPASSARSTGSASASKGGKKRACRTHGSYERAPGAGAGMCLHVLGRAWTWSDLVAVEELPQVGQSGLEVAPHQWGDRRLDELEEAVTLPAHPGVQQAAGTG